MYGGGILPQDGEGTGNYITCPGTGQRMVWINFGNRPQSNPYPACAVCQRGGLEFDHMFRAQPHNEGDN